jgi:L,D-transpeptidase ErfK/SrfK
MRLAIPGGSYLIHGTNKPAGVGMQVTHGCIRMYPENIAELFPLVPVKTQVNLVDQTNKVGWQRGTLYVERHAPLEGTDDPRDMDPAVMDALITAAVAAHSVEVDWPGARRTYEQATGVPVALSTPVRAALR